MNHVVLLGDSILDNGAYVAGGSPLVEQLRVRLHGDWRVTLLAKDGAVAEYVLRQLQQLPADATHLIVSAGGNDALESTPIVNFPADKPAAMLAELVAAVDEFHASYTRMVEALSRTGLPTIACTIYDAVPGLKPHEVMALSLFNDLIVRELATAHIPILDLRRICDQPRDYSSVSPIEPSEIGGAKIALALQNILLNHDFRRRQTVIYP
jgi:GDSL-like Lipase/Acylhydrolase family